MPLSSNPLFAAILAMDSYHRGSDAGLNVGGTQIGDAAILDIALPSGSPRCWFLGGCLCMGR
jgi:hypothetical protein